MKITRDYVRIMADAQGIPLPEEDVDNVRLRLTTWLGAMEEIEAELGEAMNATDPIPPILGKPGSRSG